MPFMHLRGHFLPGNLGVDFYDRMVTRSGSTVAQRLIDHILSSRPRPYILHRLGILLHQVMLKFLGQFPGFSQNSPIPWHVIAGSIRKLFEKDAGLDARVEAWKDAASGGEFMPKAEGRDNSLNYDDREWFRKAVKVDKNEDRKDIYVREQGFETSHWKYFHDAGAFHRFCVLHEVLPDLGMICG
jgi:hypothetical protein